MNNYSNFDVLFGKGPLAVSHPGNIHYRAFVNDHFHNFCNATRFEKFDILTKVYNEVHNNGSFLKKNPTTNKWEEADFEEVMKKIRASFRTLQRKQNKTIEASSTMSSFHSQQVTLQVMILLMLLTMKFFSMMLITTLMIILTMTTSRSFCAPTTFIYPPQLILRALLDHCTLIPKLRTPDHGRSFSRDFYLSNQFITSYQFMPFMPMAYTSFLSYLPDRMNITVSIGVLRVLHLLLHGKSL